VVLFQDPYTLKVDALASEPPTTSPAELQKVMTDLLSDEKIRPEVRRSLAQPFLDLLDQRGKIAPMEFDLGQWKDGSKLNMMRETMERTIEDVDPKGAKAVQAETTDKIKENETFHQRWVSELNSQIRGLGIKPNTEDSTLAMRYGENRMTLDELKVASPKNWETIKKTADWSRQIYDETLNALNNVRERNGYAPIPKREDYFRHFQEISATDNIFGHFWKKTSEAGLKLFGKSGKPFSSTEMQREGNSTKEDAILAMQNYIKAVGPQMFHLDSVQRIRALESYIRTQALVSETAMKDGKFYTKVDLSNFVEHLTMYGDMLAGQPSALTQAVGKMVDRPWIAAVRALSKNVTANMIAYNASSALMNLLPMAQGAPMALSNPKVAIKGLITSALHMHRDAPFEIDGVRSGLYDRRYPKGFLPENWRRAIINKGFVLPNLVDRFVVQGLIAAKYYDGLTNGLEPKAAMKAADDYAQRVVTDRSTGQIPLAMAEPDLQLFTKFQVEINNLWSWLAHDVPKDAKGNLAVAVGSWATFAIASTMINNVYEKVIGRRPQLDFLHILGTLAGITDAGKNRPISERLLPAFKEFSGNVPFGNIFLEGGKFPIFAAIPDPVKMVNDPEYEIINQMKKPLAYMLPFGGGGQIKQTLEGLTAWAQGYTTTPSGKSIRYEVNKDFSNFVRGFLAGKNAFPEAVKYWNAPKNERD
jgi:hypothetical protein